MNGASKALLLLLEASLSGAAFVALAFMPGRKATTSHAAKRSKVRVISAREMTRREQREYEHARALEHLKMLANRRDVPYQSLLKIYLAERVEEELRGLR